MERDEAYRNAEKKIEEVQRTGAKELDLSAPLSEKPKPPQLTELPESLRSPHGGRALQRLPL